MHEKSKQRAIVLKFSPVTDLPLIEISSKFQPVAMFLSQIIANQKNDYLSEEKVEIAHIFNSEYLEKGIRRRAEIWTKSQPVLDLPLDRSSAL